MSKQFKIEDMQQHASQRGGKCLSKEYWDDISRLMWMCAKGHVWESPWRFINQGYWCPSCTKEEEKEERRAIKREKKKDSKRKLRKQKLLP